MNSKQQWEQEAKRFVEARIQGKSVPSQLVWNNPELKAKLISAMESGEYERAHGAMRNGGGFCAIGVLADLKVKEGKARWHGKCVEFIGIDKDTDLLSIAMPSDGAIASMGVSIELSAVIALLNDTWARMVLTGQSDYADFGAVVYYLKHHVVSTGESNGNQDSEPNTTGTLGTGTGGSSSESIDSSGSPSNGSNTSPKPD